MSNKIEPKCKAMIVNSLAGHNGKILTVGENIGKVDGFDEFFGDRWQVDIILTSALGRRVDHVAEGQLERINIQ